MLLCKDDKPNRLKFQRLSLVRCFTSVLMIKLKGMTRWSLFPRRASVERLSIENSSFANTQSKFGGVSLILQWVSDLTFPNNPRFSVKLKNWASVELLHPMYVYSEELTLGRLTSTRIKICAYLRREGQGNPFGMRLSNCVSALDFQEMTLTRHAEVSYNLTEGHTD